MLTEITSLVNCHMQALFFPNGLWPQQPGMGGKKGRQWVFGFSFGTFPHCPD